MRGRLWVAIGAYSMPLLLHGLLVGACGGLLWAAFIRAVLHPITGTPLQPWVSIAAFPYVLLGFPLLEMWAWDRKFRIECWSRRKRLWRDAAAFASCFASQFIVASFFV